MNQEGPRSPISDEKRLDALEKTLNSTPPPKRGSRGYRDMRWLIDQMRSHHRYIAGLSGDEVCPICRADLIG